MCLVETDKTVKEVWSWVRKRLRSDLDTFFNSAKSFNNFWGLFGEELKPVVMLPLKDIKDMATKINQNVGESGAEKELKKLEEEVEKVIKTNGDEEEVKRVKKEILTFVQSKNIYKKSLRQQAQALLNKFESGQNSISSQWTIGEKIGLGLVILTGFIIIGAFVYLLIVRKSKSKKE